MIEVKKRWTTTSLGESTMNDKIVSEAVARPVSLVVVVLLWITTVPLAIWATLCAYKMATEPTDNPWQLVLFIPASLAFLSMWSVALYQSVVTRRTL